MTQQFGSDEDQENDDPALPLGWQEVADEFSGKTFFIHDAAGNVVFSRDGMFKKPPAAVCVRAAPFSHPSSVLSEPTFPAVFAVSPPPVGRKARKARKPVIIDLMTSSASEDDSATEDDERNKKPPCLSTQELELMDIPLPGDSQDNERNKKPPHLSTQDLMKIPLPGDSKDKDSDEDSNEDSNDDDDGNELPALL